ncbi:sensor histidine kinase [Actinoplanes regularis]|uniref:sensor histidine kinase n=1 Tax=Actinoplanes regularis TaxID=52697 RepID=UPI002552B75A|nr:HAMP domain-containing sensor histidine kinase [Actinoplanes regularis]GLW27770.1 two-component sensor histidine kinase [Actinoplanes regularis]
MRVNRLRRRLALLYCAASVASGFVLLLIIVVLSFGLPPSDAPAPEGGPVAAGHVPDSLLTQLRAYRSDILLLPGIALIIMAALSLAAGWVIAGRLLRPVRTMTGRLRQISDRNVHERLAMKGPRDEVIDLADTIDELLGRLETALDGHKRFVANAAHELRTPLTVEHALLEEPLATNAGIERYRANFESLIALNRARGRLLESLLTLAGSEHGAGRAEPVDLATLAEQAVRDRKAEADRHGLRVGTAIHPATLTGDPALIGRLVANLCDNAVHYNVPGGVVEVSTHRDADRALLVVTNTGPVVPPEEVDRLFEPFQRMRRVSDDNHHGLGLSIVRAIAVAHGGVLTAHASPRGGLTVEISFPAPPD